MAWINLGAPRGDISLTTPTLLMTGGEMTAETSGTRSAGSITLNTDTLVAQNAAKISARTSADGGAGNITINTGNLTLQSGGQIEASTTGSGKGGTIGIEAKADVVVSGLSADGQTPSGISANTQPNATGIGGGAGDITVSARNVLLNGGARIDSSTTGAGAGGTISLIADQNFTLSNGATVSASSSGPGNAGNITLGANNTILIDKATVTTEAREALGGNIKLTAGNEIHLTDSQVTSLVQEGSGDAGSINLDPDFIVLKNSDVKSTAVSGDGGPITLIANSAILIDPSSDLDASSLFGGSGRITIQSPIQNLSGTITPLPQNTLPVTPLYGSRCVAGAGGNFSTFVDSKADSLAPRPGTFLASPFLPLSHGPQAGAVGKAGRFSEVSGSGHAAPLQLASYVPPVLYAQADETNSACP